MQGHTNCFIVIPIRDQAVRVLVRMPVRIGVM
jgi:hypothetical protein